MSGVAIQDARFYRIVAATVLSETAVDTTYTLDLETPLKYAVTPSSQLYFFAGLSEVFERVPLGPDGNN